MPAFFETKVAKMLAQAGITIDGPNVWDPHINVRGGARKRLFRRIALNPSLGSAETYIEGGWECDDLYGFYERILVSPPGHPEGITGFYLWLQDLLINRQAGRRGRKVAEDHYDLPDELYENMLGTYKIYTCKYGDKGLAADQFDKVRLLANKGHLRPGMRVLDIGFGWGTTGELLGKICPGITYVGVSISKEQVASARRKYGDVEWMEFHEMSYAEMPDDWRKSFDLIISVGAIEHFGTKNLPALAAGCDRVLKEGGRIVFHNMYSPVSQPNEPFFDKYVFPNSRLPTLDEMLGAIAGRFVPEDFHEIGAYYAPTLRAWDDNFRAYWAKLSSKERADRYGSVLPHRWRDLPPNVAGNPSATEANRRLRSMRFYRMWRTYLVRSAVGSQTRAYYLFQLTLVRVTLGMQPVEPVR